MNEELFLNNNISLDYIEYVYPEYEQLYSPFEHFLTILDTLAHVGPDFKNISCSKKLSVDSSDEMEKTRTSHRPFFKNLAKLGYTHAQMPMLEKVEGSLYRCYFLFSTRNKDNVSSIIFALFDINDPTKILEYSDLLYGLVKQELLMTLVLHLVVLQ